MYTNQREEKNRTTNDDKEVVVVIPVMFDDDGRSGRRSVFFWVLSNKHKRNRKGREGERAAVVQLLPLACLPVFWLWSTFTFLF